ncbi:MAG: hypothetical protein EPO19_09825 [Betaproteobacteria bacterium]|nr:MAG: hypothetical protein EPO19_09825 [Betaproteobacteria bacterium]
MLEEPSHFLQLLKDFLWRERQDAPQHHVAGFAPVGIVVLRDLDGIEYNENFRKAIVLVSLRTD